MPSFWHWTNGENAILIPQCGIWFGGPWYFNQASGTLGWC